MAKYKHCTECGAAITKNEIYAEESGSLLVDPVTLCKYCAENNGYNTDPNFGDDDYDPFYGGSDHDVYE